MTLHEISWVWDQDENWSKWLSSYSGKEWWLIDWFTCVHYCMSSFFHFQLWWQLVGEGDGSTMNWLCTIIRHTWWIGRICVCYVWAFMAILKSPSSRVAAAANTVSMAATALGRPVSVVNVISNYIHVCTSLFFQCAASVSLPACFLIDCFDGEVWWASFAA